MLPLEVLKNNLNRPLKYTTRWDLECAHFGVSMANAVTPDSLVGSDHNYLYAWCMKNCGIAPDNKLCPAQYPLGNGY